MEKRALAAVGLCALILLTWTIFFAPKPPAPLPGPATGTTASGEAPGGGAAPETAGPAGPQESGTDTGPGSSPVADARGAAPRREAPEGAPPVVIETDLERIEFRNPGARLVSWTLKKYLDHEGKPYELVSPDGAQAGIHPLGFQLEDKAIEGLLNSKARFQVERNVLAEGSGEAGPPVSGAGAPGSAEEPAQAKTQAKDKGRPSGIHGPGEEIRLVFSDGQGLEAEKRLVTGRGTYLVGFSASVRKHGKPVDARVVWGPGIGTPTAEDLANRYYHGGTVVGDYGYGPQRYYSSKVSARTNLGEGLRWVGLEEQYFAAVFIAPASEIRSARIDPVVETEPPAPGAPAPAPGAKPRLVTHLAVGVPTEAEYTLFVGPKDYQLLLGLNLGLADLVNFAPTVPVLGPLIGILAKILFAALTWLHAYIGNYGLGIILLTTVIKIAFYPLTQRTMVKMRAVQQQMQRVNPKVKAIKEKYRKARDAAGRAKMNEEIMALYKREGINPMASLGGCLPLLLQLPILYAFYSVLTVSIELRQAPFFGWITDLSRRDPYYITPILMGVSMFLQQKMAMTNVTDPQQKAQQRMMLLMPLFFTWTFTGLPSGLVLYWLVNNVLGVAQQVLINRQARAIEAAGTAAVGKA